MGGGGPKFAVTETCCHFDGEANQQIGKLLQRWKVGTSKKADKNKVATTDDEIVEDNGTEA